MAGKAMDKFEVGQIKIIATREGSTPASTWSEDLCLKRVGQSHFALFVGGYEVIAETSDFFDEESGETEIPEEIGGYPVQGVEDGFVIGGEILKNEEYGEVQFSNLDLTEVIEWLESVQWSNEQILLSIRIVTET